MTDTKIAYVSGVFDLFHYGHMELLTKVRDKFPGYLIMVGVHSDEDVASYKRAPVMSMEERVRAVRASRLADMVLESAPLRETASFYLKHNITKTVHAHSVEEHEEYRKFFCPEAGDKLVRLDYTSGISTTEIIRRIGVEKECQTWSDIWQRKGEVQTTSLRLLNGYEDTDFDPKSAVEQMVHETSMRKDDTVLEVGCGAGYIAQHIEQPYTGVDRSSSLVDKLISLVGKKAIVGEANKLPFADNTFDWILCIGVFQYFDNKSYAYEVLKEFIRVARKGIYIGTLRHTARKVVPSKHIRSGPTSHVCYTMEDFEGFEKREAFYSPEEYFNVMMNLPSK